MADVENIISEIVKGLVDNSKVNEVAIDEGWDGDADRAYDIYYGDREMGLNADLQDENGIPTDAELAVIRNRISTFWAANAGWRWHDEGHAELIVA